MPKLTPVDIDPFNVGMSEALPAPQAKLRAKELFGGFGKAFMSGLQDAGRAGATSMMEALENQYVPEGAVGINDAGQWTDKQGNPLNVQRRPNIVPLTKTAEGGYEGAMPAMADVWNTMGGVGGAATLGAGPVLRPALKYKDKIYKAKEGQQHLDALPVELQDTFQKMAMSGEDISHFNFGFINHKGHFLQREDALKYAIDNGLLDPQDAKYGTLVTTMLNDSGAGGKLASQAVASSKKNLEKEIRDLIVSAKKRGVNVDIDPPDYPGGDIALNWIERKYSNPAGEKTIKGEGAKIIQELNSIADKNKTEVRLLAIADKEGQELVNYYKKLGFKPISKLGDHPDGIQMSRKPLLNDSGGGQKLASQTAAQSREMKYPLAKHEDWWGQRQYDQQGGRMETMSPDEFLNKSRPLKIDESSRENIEELKQHILSGKTLDPLNLQQGGKEDGRHRAIAAKELGIKEVPVINFRPAPTFYSAAEKAVEGIKQNKASGDQWINTLLNQKGVKGEELEWTGLKEFLKDKPYVTKQEIQNYLKNNKVELQEVWKGTDKPLTIDQVKQLAAEGKPFHAIEKANPERVASVTLDNGQLLPWAEKNADKFIFRQGTFEDAVNLKGNSTKYHNYQLPGATNYKELLLTLPQKGMSKEEAVKQSDDIWENQIKQLPNFPSDAHILNQVKWAKENAPAELFNKYNELQDIANQVNTDKSLNYHSSHWDEPNPLVHMRMNDRTIDGKKSLHLEEIQSDWHQQGRDKGYHSKELPELPEGSKAKTMSSTQGSFIVPYKGRELSFQIPWTPEKGLDIEAAKLEARKFIQKDSGVPDAPFKKTWHELALKRAIREAAENGYERLSWTPGEAQAARYDLSKQVDKIEYNSETKILNAFGKNNQQMIYETNITPEKLADYVGKEAAEKLLKQPMSGKYNNVQKLENADLKIGGEGMKGFYDQIIPKSIEKIAKEFGVKVKKDNLPVNDKQIDKLWKEFENTKPDEIAEKKYKKEWDELVKARRRLQPLIDDTKRELTNAEYEIVKKDWDEVNKNMDAVHESMVRDTLLRKQKELKGDEIFYIDIPENMRQSIVGKGQPLFSGTPTLTPIDYQPEFEEEIK